MCYLAQNGGDQSINGRAHFSRGGSKYCLVQLHLCVVINKTVRYACMLYDGFERAGCHNVPLMIALYDCTYALPSVSLYQSSVFV